MDSQRQRIKNRSLSLQEIHHSRISCEAQDRSCRRILKFVFTKWWIIIDTLSSVARREIAATRDRMVDLFDFRLAAALRELYIYTNVPHPKEDCIVDCRFRVVIANDNLRLWGGNFYSEEDLESYFG